MWARAPARDVLVANNRRKWAMTWHPGSDPARATRVEVCFDAADDGGTILQLRHDGWAARADGSRVRGRYDGGWDAVLGRFVSASAGESS